FEMNPPSVTTLRPDISKPKSESPDKPPIDTINEGFDGEMSCKVYCKDHEVPENFLTMNTRDPQSHQSALYAYIKKYKKYDLSQRERKLQTRYTLTIPEHIKAQMDAQKAWYELSTTDDDSEDSSDDEFVNKKGNRKKEVEEDIKLKDIEDALIKITRFSIGDAINIICHRCYQNEKASIGEVPEEGIKTEDTKKGEKEF
ncbi:4093_t:CDS:2, partial [Acaulospora colombiana]